MKFDVKDVDYDHTELENGVTSAMSTINILNVRLLSILRE